MKTEPTQREAYEALRTLMWETDLMRQANQSVPVGDCLTILCRYLTRPLDMPDSA